MMFMGKKFHIPTTLAEKSFLTKGCFSILRYQISPDRCSIPTGTSVMGQEGEQDYE